MGREVAGAARRRDDQLVARWPRAVPGRPGAAGGSTCPAAGSGWRPTCTGSSSGRRVHHLEQQVDVDGLGGQPGPHDVVAGAHQLDAGAAEVGVEVARPELQRLARVELHVVEQQRDHDARVAGVALGQLDAPSGPRGGRSPAQASTIGCDRDAPGEERPDGVRPRRLAAKAPARRSRPSSSSRADRLVRRAHAAERLERGRARRAARAWRRVDVAAELVAGAGLLGVGMGLQRQRLGRGQHLEQVRQRSR